MIDRIKQVLDYSQLSTTAFADTIGISRSGLTHLLTGRNQPSLDVARKILAQFPEISTEWLIMGMGDMFRKDDPLAPRESVPREAPLSVKEQPAENSKMMRQTDLFGEYETQNEPEVVVEDMSQSDNSTDKEEDSSEEEPFIPQSMAVTNPAPVLNQGSRTRAKSAPASSKREKSVNNVPERKLQKIVFFYDDHSFEVFAN